MSTAISIQTGDAFQLREKVGQLSQAILSKHPTMPTLLREIHTTIRQYPEQITLLEEEDIAIIVAGLSVQTNVAFSQAANKPAAVKSLASKIKQLGVDAF
jgi:hypothetical protein